MSDAEILRLAIYESERRMREIETRIAVKTGYACPAPDCGLRYRHQHGETWWPPKTPSVAEERAGQPLPPT